MASRQDRASRAGPDALPLRVGAGGGDPWVCALMKRRRQPGPSAAATAVPHLCEAAAASHLLPSPVCPLPPTTEEVRVAPLCSHDVEQTLSHPPPGPEWLPLHQDKALLSSVGWGEGRAVALPPKRG